MVPVLTWLFACAILAELLTWEWRCADQSLFVINIVLIMIGQSKSSHFEHKLNEHVIVMLHM